MKRVIIIILILIMFFAAGCNTVVEQKISQDTSEAINGEATEIPYEEVDYNDNIPGLTLEYNDTACKAVRGTYSWTKENKESGEFSCIDADSGPPEEMVEYQEQQITIKEATDIHLVFDREPESYTVRIWSSEDYDLSKEIETDYDRISIEANQPCTIYEVTAVFGVADNIAGSGTIHYAFVVNEQNKYYASDIIVIGEGEPSEEQVSSSDVIVVVSNQSFDNPKVLMNGSINGVTVFDDKFEVKNQHEYSYYFITAEAGEYDFYVTAGEAALSETIQIVEDEKLWVYVTYWKSENENEHIDILMQKEQLGLG